LLLISLIYRALFIWDGGKVNSEKVSKWVVAKLKGVAACRLFLV